MYTVSIETGFCATHRVRLPDGELEPPHGHDWVVRARFARAELDAHGMVVDFVQVTAALNEIVHPWHHADLNTQPVFGGGEPTAERVARVVFDRLRAAGLTCLERVEVTEAPGCVAAYERSARPDPKPD